MRIVSVNEGNFWSAHVTTEDAVAPASATGESLDHLIKGVNGFTADYPGDVIVWVIKYMVDLNNGNLTSRDQRYWDANKANAFYTKLEEINNRCVGLKNEP